MLTERENGLLQGVAAVSNGLAYRALRPDIQRLADDLTDRDFLVLTNGKLKLTERGRAALQEAGHD